MELLTELVDLFYDNPADLGEFCHTPRQEVPEPFRGLLVHEHHMTVTVERYHESLVDVVVLDRLKRESLYARKILLTRQSDGRTVQFGLVRLKPEFLEPIVAEQIMSEQIPLGRVLIEHNVLREISLLEIWNIKPGPDLRKHLFLQPGQTCYGRTALIYCNGQPAIELLEIIPPVPVPTLAQHEPAGREMPAELARNGSAEPGPQLPR